jgi:predicted DNA-binding transcriptional regulator AlpA
MQSQNRTEQLQNERFVNCLEACEMLGLEVANPGHVIRYYVRTGGFPGGVKIGRWRKWKASQVLAWRENRHAMSK